MSKSFVIKLAFILCFSTILCVDEMVSQVHSIANWEEIGEQLLSDDQEEEKRWDNNFEDLEDLRENPLNINMITKEQLERFPFLTDLQIEHLLYYLYVSGPMETIYELQLVEDMDRQTIQYLLPFVFVGKVEKNVDYPKFKELIKYGKNECLIRFDIPLNKKDGYRNYSDSILSVNPNKCYLGNPYYHSIKYSFRYKDNIYWGLNAEKDAGEPFFSGKNKKGYDFYSFYFYLRNFKNLKALAIGNYRLSFGLGLVLSTDYNMGKSSSIATINSRQTGIKKHSSMDEYNYFQGAAASYRLRNFLISGFYSYRRLDAIVENMFITSLKTDGMHRIERDFEKKNKAVNQIIGMNINTSYKELRVGMTVVYNFFNKMLKFESKPYSIFYPQGKNFFNCSIDYSYRWNKIVFSGETAIDKGGRVATLNSMRFSPLSGYQLVLLQRNYPKDYQALLARSISENNGVKNENGVYIGLEAKPIRFWNFFAYADFFQFPWLKYGVDKPSSGFDGLIQAIYTPKKNLTMFWRYRYKKKEKNYSDKKTGIESVLPYFQHKFRYQLSFTFQENFFFRTTIDYVRLGAKIENRKNGFMLNQPSGYNLPKYPLRLDIHYGYFDTDDYSSRISVYEKSILYVFSMPSFYDKGMRFAMNVHYDISRMLAVILRIAHTRYATLKEIGTGLEKIGDNQKSDVYAQLRWKF